MPSSSRKPAPRGALAASDQPQVFSDAVPDTAHASVERLNVAFRERYVVHRELGRGGTAAVYLADDLRRARPVALKLLGAEVAAALTESRFRREVEILRQLDHPNILPLLDFGSVDGELYFTMPLIDGETLRERIRRERQLGVTDVVAIARDVARALDHAHARGIVHRDVKPANVLLGPERAIVADFGIARAMKIAGEDRLTASGLAIGTPEYMSPEQGSGARQLDARSDVYALGCVVYEMLAGEPPFTGATVQAVIARHCCEPVRSLRVIRPSIPLAVERTIERALAKVPADRFASAGEFVERLEAAAASRDEPSPRRRPSALTTTALGVAAVALVAAGSWYALRPAPPLDPNRIVVFPLHDPGAPSAGEREGGDVATWIGYALDGTRPLKWLDGWELLDSAQRVRGERLDPEDARSISARAGARYYIDGAIVRRPDSASVLLSVFDLGGDSVLRRIHRTAAAGSSPLPQLGVAAVGALLPDLLAPGRKIDLTELTDRAPLAVANFLQGEREYRLMQFKPAVAHYEAALRDDSAFSLAALRGAQAALWLRESGVDVRLARTALRRAGSLPPTQALLARGLHGYLTGAADSAIFDIRRALALDSTVHAGWTLLGHVYLYTLPAAGPADALARDALERARQADPDFAPTLLLLEEIALRRGRVPEALHLRDELRKASADTSHAASRSIMLRCVRDGSASVDWRREIERDELAVLTSAKILGGGASQPACAVAAFRSLLQADTTSRSTRWAALLGLQVQLAATRRTGAAADVFHWKGVADLPVRLAYLLLASAGAGFDREARAVADSSSVSYGSLTPVTLWHLGLWEARETNLPRLRAIARALASKADSSGARRERLLSGVTLARLRLLEGDSAAAIRLLRQATPSAPPLELGWQPWESLGAERLLLAQLLFARGDVVGAAQVAAQLDAAAPLTYPLYVRTSLELRSRIAERLGDSRAREQYRFRLRQLGPGAD